MTPDESLISCCALKDLRRPGCIYYAGSGKGWLNRIGGRFGGCAVATGTYGDLCWPAGLEATA
jgi:hypothetical protein